jgi:lauroyl/myristoyl acyltransferase
MDVRHNESWFKVLTSSRAAIRTARWLAQHVPPSAAAGLGSAIGRWLTIAGGRMYSAIRANQAQVRGLPLDDPSLDQAVIAVLRHAGQVYYDLFRQAFERHPMALTPRAAQNLQAAIESGRGLLLVGAHLSNFDLGIQYVTSRQIPIQLLSLTEPTGGFQFMNALRANPLCEVTPVSQAALRKAIQRLRAGGIVATGVDRPVPGQLEMLPFFGRPAPLPVGHIRLAMKTNAQVMAMWCEWSPQRGYLLHAGPLMDMEQPPLPPDEQVRHNALRVLRVLEAAIARRPEQWLMFIPVWS